MSPIVWNDAVVRPAPEPRRPATLSAGRAAVVELDGPAVEARAAAATIADEDDPHALRARLRADQRSQT